MAPTASIDRAEATQATEALRAGLPLLVLQLAGSQAEMGRQHGELLVRAGGYRSVVDYYPRMPAILMGKERGGIPGPILRPLLELALRSLHRDRPVEYRERSREFFAALGYPRRNSQHLFVMDLLQNVVGLAGRFGLGPSRRLLTHAAVPACSSVAVWGRASRDGTLRHARNFDFPGAGLWEQAPAVVFCRPDRGLRYGFVTTRGADAPGVTGWNEAGITIGAHTRFHRHVRFSGAGIVDLGHELVRRAETLSEAVKIARERRVASTWGILVSSARERSAALLEITGRSVEVVRPPAGEDFLAQTNRYRSLALKKDEVAPCVGHVANSDGRARALRARVLASAEEGLDALDLEALLGDQEHVDAPGVARPGGGILAQPISVQSVVAEPEARALRVSVGPCPTGKGPWVTVPWTWEGPVASRIVDARSARGARASGKESARHEAHERYLEAVSLDGQGHSRAAIARTLEDACALDPREPVYRLLAGALALKAGDAPRALAHFRAGLEHERAPYPRGQLLLWASRAAGACERREEAGALRRELEGLDHGLLHDHRSAARREADRPLGLRALERLDVNLVFPDVTL